MSVRGNDACLSFAGSPADRAALEVGDEIVEVNGKCVDRCAHSEIISHIHQVSVCVCVCVCV